MQRSEVADEKGGLWWTIPRGKLKMRRNPSLPDLRLPLIGRAEAIVRRRLAATGKDFLFHSRARRDGKTDGENQSRSGLQPAGSSTCTSFSRAPWS